MKQKYVKRRITWVDILLLVIFIGLLILVCYLGYKTFTVSKQNVETVDIIIPLIKKGEPQEFSVDLSLLEPDGLRPSSLIYNSLSPNSFAKL